MQFAIWNSLPEEHFILDQFKQPQGVSKHKHICITDQGVTFFVIPSQHCNGTDDLQFARNIYDLVMDTFQRPIEVALGVDLDRNSFRNFLPFYAALKDINPYINTIDAYIAEDRHSHDIDHKVSYAVLNDQDNMAAEIIKHISPSRQREPKGGWDAFEKKVIDIYTRACNGFMPSRPRSDLTSLQMAAGNAAETPPKSQLG